MLIPFIKSTTKGISKGIFILLEKSVQVFCIVIALLIFAFIVHSLSTF
jgi:hypothetical protein